MLPATPDRDAVPCRSGFVFSTLCSVLLALCVTAWAHAPTADLVRTPVDPANRVSLTGHHPAWANARNDVGAVPADLSIESLTVVLAHSPQGELAYTQFLQDQQNPVSPDYHHWLTPVEIGKRFGVSTHDIHAVTVWLQSQSLHVDSISNSRERIVFSGPASGIANAFGSEMHYFTVDGEKRISITAEPQIPAALGKVIKSISGLYTINVYPQHGAETVHLPSHNMASDSGIVTEPEATLSNGSHIIFPTDFATIYSINGVAGGINGTGQTIAIVGRSRVYVPDITNFASLAGVTINLNPPNGVVPRGGLDPGAAKSTGGASGDQSEATLDVTRSGSIAQGATILLVVSADSQTVDGIGVDAQYVVDTMPVPAQIMSISFGACEANAGLAGVQFWDSVFKQAAGEGISVFVSSGDSGAAGCDTAFKTPPASQIHSPNFICSSGWATCVGGTEFADFANPTQYWSPTNGPGFESALSYIPEGAWNEPLNGQMQVQVAGTGGGVSAFITPTPPWQVGTGVPSARAGRYTPDLAFSASSHDGYFACLAANGGSCVQSGGSFSFVVFAGTSAAAPDMAGIAALLNQKEGTQGTLNPQLYTLAATPANNVFNDVTVTTSGVTNCVLTTPSMCNNSTAGPHGLTGGLSGYLVTPGYDEATGLGSINVANLLTNWISTIVATTTKLITLAPTSVTAGSSGPVVIVATVTSSGGTPTGNLEFVNGSTMVGTAPLSNGTATFNYNPNALTGGTYPITASYPWNSNFANSTSAAQTLSVQDFQIAASPNPVTVTAPGKSGTTTLTITPLGGFNQTLSYSCNQTTLPSEATCTFTSASATSETLMIATMAPSARLDKGPLGRSRGIFYALLLPGFLGLVVSAGNRKRTLRGVRLLSLIAVLALSTLWMPACGGGSSSSSTQSNPGTPTGTSTVTVTATTGGTGALTHPVTITLTVK
ncbi:MAG TPA: protease pro-enzyme activation domain-containing protein [Terriglobales bacterium]|nr:protease pro-enzyme activation domain-containing protein [Terriglobales bacterium]